MKEDITINSLFNLDETIAKDFLFPFTYPWEALPHIGDFIIKLGNTLDLSKYDKVSENVWIAKNVKIMDSVSITGPCIIEENTSIRQSAFIRGNVIIGKNCVVGNSTEIKNSILFNNVQVPHFNYVGDSILGFSSHMGAGAITSNVRSDRENVIIKGHFRNIETGLKKIGAALGDFVEVGCNSVLNPGTIIGKNTIVYPLSSVRGVVPKESIYKGNGDIVDKK